MGAITPRQVVELINCSSTEFGIHDVNGAKIYVAPDEAQMGRIAGLHILYHLRCNTRGKVRFDFARAPSQVKAWHALAEHWPRGIKASNVTMFPFDEIRGAKYAALEAQELRGRLPKDALQGKVEIQAGDCGEAHARAEAERLNGVIARYNEAGVFRMALAGTSPNADLNTIRSPTYDPSDYEVHLAFHRAGLGMPEQPFIAIPMSNAASKQQQRERVIGSAGSINSDWVVTMTAWLLALQTDVIVFSIPDKRGINLWRILHESPENGTPATLMQRHPGLNRRTDDGVSKVIYCTTQQSWEQYQAAAEHFDSTSQILGT